MGRMKRRLKEGDRLKALKNFITSDGVKEYKITKGKEYLVIEANSKYVGIKMTKDIVARFPVNSRLFEYFEILNGSVRQNRIFKWTNIYTDNGFTKTTILYDTREKALAEYNDMKVYYPDVQLQKISYNANNTHQ